jgi:hypothetical protein
VPRLLRLYVWWRVMRLREPQLTYDQDKCAIIRFSTGVRIAECGSPPSRISLGDIWLSVTCHLRLPPFCHTELVFAAIVYYKC